MKASVSDGHIRQAIADLIAIAREHGCVSITIENLDFASARATGRQTMGRGVKAGGSAGSWLAFRPRSSATGWPA